MDRQTPTPPFDPAGVSRIADPDHGDAIERPKNNIRHAIAKGGETALLSVEHFVERLDVKAGRNHRGVFRCNRLDLPPKLLLNCI